MEENTNGNKKSMWVWVLIVVVVVAGLVYISINNRKENNDNTPMEQNEMVAKAGDRVSMNYTGMLTDGTVFDSNVDPKFNHVMPFEFNLGAGEVIAGWDKGITGMKVGEKKRLEIAPEDGYGAGGVPGVIPANATLIFDVELIAIQ